MVALYMINIRDSWIQNTEEFSICFAHIKLQKNQQQQQQHQQKYTCRLETVT